jgi:aminoglycoside phosphotransferase family enzyme
MKRQRPAQQGCAAKVEFLRDSGAYPEGARHVEVIETHFSWIFLTDTHAYKLKKPLHQAPMDYRTLTGRMRGCRTEVRLNRRLAPTVYLGIMPLGRQRSGHLVLGRGGRIIDWLVAMRRLPAARMLDEVMAREGVTAAELRALVGLLGSFYARARPRPMSPSRYLQHLGGRTLANGRELLRREFQLPAREVQALTDAQLGFIHLHAQRLGARSSRLVEAHGDLRPEHVYLGSLSEGPAVIDCLEFDAALRRLDPIEEVASLAMECMSQGATALARNLLNGLRAEMQDPASDALVHFYMSQRAATRAKLAAWHLRDPTLTPRFEHWRARATGYLDSALLFARMAVRQSSRELSSLLEGHRPAFDQGRQGLSRKHSSKRLTK